MCKHRRFTVRETQAMSVAEIVQELRNRGWWVAHGADFPQPTLRSDDEHHSNRH